MPMSSLFPNVDQRFQDWLKRQRERKTPVAPPQKLTICISRMYGCEAYPLAELLAQDLEQRTGEKWTIFDKLLIEEVSQDQGLSKKLLENLDLEKVFQKPSEVLSFLFSSNWKPAYKRAYELLTKYIIKIADEGNAIIIGRGGEVITQQISHCLQFRLEGSLEFRVQSIAGRMGITLEEARSNVEENQLKREKFIESFHGCDTSDAKYYNAIFNNGRCSVEVIAECIMAIVAGSKLHDKIK